MTMTFFLFLFINKDVYYKGAIYDIRLNRSIYVCYFKTPGIVGVSNLGNSWGFKPPKIAGIKIVIPGVNKICR